MSDQQKKEAIGVGAIPFAHAFSPLAHGASFVPVGMEGGLGTCCFPEEEPDVKCKDYAFQQPVNGRYFW